jgi:hypothetical protein
MIPSDNYVFTKERLASYVETTTSHKESSLLGVERRLFSSHPKFKYLEASPKEAPTLISHTLSHLLLFYPYPHTP